MSWTLQNVPRSITQIGDNGTFSGPSTTTGDLGTTITNVGAQNGDLLVIVAHYKGNATLTVTGSNQTWNSLTQRANGTTSVARMFWCVYNGTSDTTGQVTVTSGTAALNAILFCFRATGTIAKDGTETGGTFTNASTTITITGPTVSAASTVTIASWASEDDNTWGTLTGTGWTKPLIDTVFAQQRNLSGTDMSDAIAYNIQTSAGTLANVSQTQTALGPDAGIWMTASWSETVSFIPSKPIIYSQGVNRAANY